MKYSRDIKMSCLIQTGQETKTWMTRYLREVLNNGQGSSNWRWGRKSGLKVSKERTAWAQNGYLGKTAGSSMWWYRKFKAGRGEEWVERSSFWGFKCQDKAFELFSVRLLKGFKLQVLFNRAHLPLTLKLTFPHPHNIHITHWGVVLLLDLRPMYQGARWNSIKANSSELHI